MATRVTAAQAGTYRQISWKLRLQGRTDLNGPRFAGEVRGATAETNVRPRDPRSGRYLDSDAAPTLLVLREGDLVDIEALLRSGGIVSYTPPPAAEPTAREEGVRGKTGRKQISDLDR